MAAQRGSEKLWKQVFESERPQGEHLAKALSLEAEEFAIKRWWWYGQPAYWDLIQGVVEVDVASFGKVASSLVGLHGSDVQVSFEVFPYGIVAPETLRIELKLERNIRST